MNQIHQYFKGKQHTYNRNTNLKYNINMKEIYFDDIP